MKFRNGYITSLLGAWMWMTMVFGQEQQRLLRSLVPGIDQQNYRLIPDGQNYDLVIDLPDGSRRIENVELRSPDTPDQELHVMGTITNFYPKAKLIIEYEAGKDGYIAKYVYKKDQQIYVGFLSPIALKAAAG